MYNKISFKNAKIFTAKTRYYMYKILETAFRRLGQKVRMGTTALRCGRFYHGVI